MFILPPKPLDNPVAIVKEPLDPLEIPVEMEMEPEFAAFEP
jgi:hypothetical protein